MSDLYLGDDGDIKVSVFKDVVVLDKEDDDVLQMAINNIITIMGENPFHENLGNNVFHRRLKITDSDADTIAKDCAGAMMNDNRIQQVADIAVYYDENDRHNLEIEFKIITTYGTVIPSTVQIHV